ncbi:hypothetical protein GW17_00061472, partial [Ensete ventricosum]
CLRFSIPKHVFWQNYLPRLVQVPWREAAIWRNRKQLFWLSICLLCFSTLHLEPRYRWRPRWSVWQQARS